MRTRPTIKVADEVWIAAALLHRENPRRQDFTVTEIVERAKQERRSPVLRLGENRRRLFLPGDLYHAGREGAKMAPAPQDIPGEYHELLDWYHREYARRGARRPEADPLLDLRGSGKALWADEHADDYVRRLRERWA